MKVIHKNSKEDLKLLVSLGDKYNGEEFSLVFTSGKLAVRKFECSYKDGVYTNCEMADATHVLCLLDNHELSLGLLSVTTTVYLPDSQMPDGNLKVVDTRLVEALNPDGVPFHIELTKGESDSIETSEVIWNLLGTVLKGERGPKGETGEQGPQGQMGPKGDAGLTPEERQSLLDAIDLAEKDNEAVQEAIKASEAQVEAAKVAEQQRSTTFQQSESSRATAFSVAQNERQSQFNEDLSDWDESVNAEIAKLDKFITDNVASDSDIEKIIS